MKKVIGLLVLVVGLVSCEKNVIVENSIEGMYEGTFTVLFPQSEDTTFTTTIELVQDLGDVYLVNSDLPFSKVRVNETLHIKDNGDILILDSDIHSQFTGTKL